MGSCPKQASSLSDYAGIQRKTYASNYFRFYSLSTIMLFLESGSLNLLDLYIKRKMRSKMRESIVK